MARELTTAETVKIIRVLLRQCWQSIKWSVRSDTYAGGASIEVHWLDGPTVAEVEAVVKRFEGASFDALTDLKTYRAPIEWRGEMVHSGADWIFCKRHIGPDLMAQAVAQVKARYGLAGDCRLSEPTQWSYGGVELMASEALDAEAFRITGRWFAALVYDALEADV